MTTKLLSIGLAAALAACGSSKKDTAAGSDVPETRHALVEGEVEHAQHAEASLDSAREIAIARMESRLQLLAIQEPMLRALTDVLPLTANGRTDVEAKLDAFTRQVEQAQLALDAVETGSAGTDPGAAERTAHATLQLADQARQSAWKSIGAARVPPPVDTGTSIGSNANGSAAVIPPST